MADASGERVTLRRPAHSVSGGKELHCDCPLNLPGKSLSVPCCLPDLELIWTLGTWVCYPPNLLCDIVADCEWLVLLLG